MLSHHFKIFTDHKTINEYLLGQWITTPAQQKWLLKLIDYDYSIHYKVGKNCILDTLSRRKELSALTGVPHPIYQFVQEIQESCLRDGPIKDIIQQLSQGVNIPNYILHNS